MKIQIFIFFVVLIQFIFVSNVSASSKQEIDFLLSYGQRVLMEGGARSEKKWDRACLLRKRNIYVAIVQTDRSNYRIMPVPLGKIVEKMCPAAIFGDAIKWMNRLKYREN